MVHTNKTGDDDGGIKAVEFTTKVANEHCVSKA